MTFVRLAVCINHIRHFYNAFYEIYIYIYFLALRLSQIDFLSVADPPPPPHTQTQQFYRSQQRTWHSCVRCRWVLMQTFHLCKPFGIMLIVVQYTSLMRSFPPPVLFFLFTPN